MSATLASDPRAMPSVSLWRDPRAWLQEKNLGREYWIFFVAAFFYDTGFALYWFLFNLYLLDFHFDERAIGLINGALGLGSLVGMLPTAAIIRRWGARPVLIFCFVVAPLLNVLRVVCIWEPAQIALAFVAGLSMCSWGATFLPVVSKLTTNANRTSAISLIFSVGVGCSALAGAASGFLQQGLAHAGIHLQAFQVKGLILLAACGFAAIGVFPVLRLRLTPTVERVEATKSHAGWRSAIRLNRFLPRFLVSMALWSAVLAAFLPFANVYLTRGLHLPLAQVGVIFSTAQLLQLGSGLLVPALLRWMGELNGIVVTQLAAVLSLISMAYTHNASVAVCLYLSFFALQWMSSPALYSLLMNQTPESDRSAAAASALFANSLIGSLTTAATGALLANFGYSRVISAIACSGACVAVLCRVLLERKDAQPVPDDASAFDLPN